MLTGSAVISRTTRLDHLGGFAAEVARRPSALLFRAQLNVPQRRQRDYIALLSSDHADRSPPLKRLYSANPKPRECREMTAEIPPTNEIPLTEDDDAYDETESENEAPVRETDDATELPEEMEYDDEDDLPHPEDYDADDEEDNA